MFSLDCAAAATTSTWVDDGWAKLPCCMFFLDRLVVVVFVTLLKFMWGVVGVLFTSNVALGVVVRRWVGG